MNTGNMSTERGQKSSVELTHFSDMIFYYFF